MTDADQQVFDRLEGFLSFLRVVEEADASVGTHLSRRSEDPSMDFTIRGIRYPDRVHELGRVLREAGWMQERQMDVEVRCYREKPELIGEASLHTLKCLLTAYQRGERTYPGTWEEALNSGFVRRIVERLVELRDAADESNASGARS